MTKLGSRGWLVGARFVATLAAVIALLLTGCGFHAPGAGSAETDAEIANAARVDSPPLSSIAAEFAVPASGDLSSRALPPLTGTLSRPDMLVIGTEPLPARLRERITALAGARTTMRLSLASVRVLDRSITVAAVEPAVFRRFTPKPTATAGGVWRAVAAGEVVLNHQIAADLHQPLGGTLAIRQPTEELSLRIGAYATTVPQIHAVVNEQRREQLGMTRHNALLVTLGGDDIAAEAKVIQDVVARRAQVQPLWQDAAAAVVSHAASLTGGEVASAVGSFSYRSFPDGSVRPQHEWVAANIRTESVPILGRVTCHRVMLPQLRAALTEVSQRGLAAAIAPDDYGGCYVPRFIDRDPRRGLSLHTWGIAIDLNVAGNQRGTVGQIDRDVVAVFKKWGFAWGGDWEWTDPMHFELAALVRE